MANINVKLVRSLIGCKKDQSFQIPEKTISAGPVMYT